jgi:hypothetical protein
MEGDISEAYSRFTSFEECKSQQYDPPDHIRSLVKRRRKLRARDMYSCVLGENFFYKISTRVKEELKAWFNECWQNKLESSGLKNNSLW